MFLDVIINVLMLIYDASPFGQLSRRINKLTEWLMISIDSAHLKISEDIFSVLVLALLENSTEQRSCGRNYTVYEEKDRLFGRQLQTLSYHIHELATRQICWHEVFLLVDVLDSGLIALLCCEITHTA